LLPINEPAGYIQRLAEYKRWITLCSSQTADNAALIRPTCKAIEASVTELRDDHDWDVSGPEVLSYLRMNEDEFIDIKEEILRYQE